jgi:hypothetical protein
MPGRLAYRASDELLSCPVVPEITKTVRPLACEFSGVEVADPGRIIGHLTALEELFRFTQNP